MVDSLSQVGGSLANARLATQHQANFAAKTPDRSGRFPTHGANSENFCSAPAGTESSIRL